MPTSSRRIARCGFQKANRTSNSTARSREIAAASTGGSRPAGMRVSASPLIPVSYTHLDVYKRQAFRWLCLSVSGGR